MYVKQCLNMGFKYEIDVHFMYAPAASTNRAHAMGATLVYRFTNSWRILEFPIYVSLVTENGEVLTSGMYASLS